jgi:hypothetical protein
MVVAKDYVVHRWDRLLLAVTVALLPKQIRGRRVPSGALSVSGEAARPLSVWRP